MGIYESCMSLEKVINFTSSGVEQAKDGTKNPPPPKVIGCVGMVVPHRLSGGGVLLVVASPDDLALIEMLSQPSLLGG